MAIPQTLKQYEKEPFRMRIRRGFCSDVRIYEEYSANYRKLFSLVWDAVQNGELTEEEGREIMEKGRNVRA